MAETTKEGAQRLEKLPGGEISTRALHIIFLCDCSGSMNRETKIQSLNEVMKAIITPMQEAAATHERVKALVRVVKFSDTADWHVKEPTPVMDFKWADLSAEGTTAMGGAFRLVAEQLKSPPLEKRIKIPVLILITDGMATDDVDGGFKALLDVPAGGSAVRIAIAIGTTDVDTEQLQTFVASQSRDVPVLYARNPEQLLDYIRWASSLVVGSVAGDERGLPPPPQVKAAETSADDPLVWG